MRFSNKRLFGRINNYCLPSDVHVSDFAKVNVFTQIMNVAKSAFVSPILLVVLEKQFVKESWYRRGCQL